MKPEVTAQFLQDPHYLTACHSTIMCFYLHDPFQ